MGELRDTLKLFIESLDDLVLIANEKGKFIQVNQVTINKLGFSEDELLKKGILDIYSQENKLEVSEYLEGIFKGTQESFNSFLVKKDKSLLASKSKVWLGEYDNSRCIFVMIKDLSKQQELKGQMVAQSHFYQQIVDQIPSMFYMKNLQLEYIGVNVNYAKEYFGQKSEDMIGKKDDDFFLDEKELEKRKEKEMELFAKKSNFTVEDTVTLVNGETIFVKEERFPLYNEEKQIIGLIGLISDLSEQKEMEKFTVEAKENSQSAIVVKHQFLANISHEMRTPMNGISGFLQLLANTRLDSAQKEYLRNIEISAHYLETVISDILDFSKIESGKFVLETIPFDFYELIEDAMVPFTAEAKDKNIYLNLFIDTNMTQNVLGDPIRIKQVVTNLLSNAVKFTQQGSVFLRVRQEEVVDHKIKVLIELSDTGIGISKEAQKALFQPFLQGDGSTSRRFGGNGLGLSIAQDIVARMGGTIEVDSEEGYGSKFIVTLMLEKNNNIEMGDELPKILLNEVPIMIIDPNSENSRVVEAYLKQMGALPTIVASGNKALVELMSMSEERKPYAMVLISEELSDLKPYDLLAALKTISSTKSIPILFLANKASAWNYNSQGGFEFTDKITWPYRKHEMLLTIVNHLPDKMIEEQANNQNQSDQDASISNIPFIGSGKVLIAESNELNYKFLSTYLAKRGIECDVATTGNKAIELAKEKDYKLIFIDYSIPGIDIFEVTRTIRNIKKINKDASDKSTTIIAMYSKTSGNDIAAGIQSGIDEYLAKPIDKMKLQYLLQKHEVLIPMLKTEQVEVPSNNHKEDGKQRILIVDDVQMNIKILAASLEEDYEISIADGGLKAIQIAQSKERPDLILLDIMMPEINGYEVFVRLRNDPDTKDIPVIFLTAMSDPENEEYGLKLGAIDYIVKPFSIPVVKAKVKNYLLSQKRMEVLKENSTIDTLTKIPNRRKYDEVLKAALNSAKQNDTELSVLMIDIDYFKKFNDTYGHLEGDVCLKRVAQVIKTTLRRKEDFVARWGGEEFVCLLPGASMNAALDVGERVRMAVERLGVPHSKSQIGKVVTVSIGVATGTVDNDYLQDDLMKFADKALYEAKRTGRNKVFAY